VTKLFKVGTAPFLIFDNRVVMKSKYNTSYLKYSLHAASNGYCYGYVYL